MKSLYEHICDVNTLNAAFNQVAGKVKQNRFRRIFDEGISFHQIRYHQADYIGDIYSALVNKTEILKPARELTIPTDGRNRKICKLQLQELILHYAVAAVLNREVKFNWTPQLYSYQKGKSNFLALENFCIYLKNYSRRVRLPLERRLYVLKLDVKNYAEEMPSNPQSLLWKKLTAALADSGVRMDQTSRDLLWSCLKPVYESKTGIQHQNYNGIPVGSPLTPLLCNFYLKEIDDYFAKQKVFYSRFGDDLLVASESYSEFSQHLDFLNNKICELGLKWNNSKRQMFCFNNAGRPYEGLPGCDQFKYLGYTINFRGDRALPPDKVRTFLREVEHRLKNYYRTLNHLTGEGKNTELVRFYNSLFAANEFTVLHTSALNGFVNSRQHLRSLDYSLRRIVAGILSGTGTATGKCFRQFPPKRLIHQYHMLSFEKQKNGKGGFYAGS